MAQFSTLALDNPSALTFGVSPKPVRCGSGLTIGGGQVYPELNFTLPPILIEEATWKEVKGHYEEIAAMIVRASRRLHLPGLVVEFELLPPMTENPEWGAEITGILHAALKQAHDEYGLPSALRVTPTDIRERVRPPVLRSGDAWETLCKSFDLCAEAGADILSIESVGGKEVHDQALLYGDVRGALFALGVLAPRDMEWLWKMIVSSCTAHKVVPGGDSACGFANTAMQLAGQGMLPEVLATLIRAASTVRSLVAFEVGALGPSKDCAYEGPVMKAIAGVPIAMEGKSASCAHFSPVGNVAAAMCDLWSNESVQNVRLLSGSAPEAFLELLAYDCRIFNKAIEKDGGKHYKSLLVESDVNLSPQALILSPESTIRISRAIVGEKSHYLQTVAAAKTAVQIMREAVPSALKLSPRELQWLQKIEDAVEEMPADEDELLSEMRETYGTLFAEASYGL